MDSIEAKESSYFSVMIPVGTEKYHKIFLGLCIFGVRMYIIPSSVGYISYSLKTFPYFTPCPFFARHSFKSIKLSILTSPKYKYYIKSATELCQLEYYLALGLFSFYME
jgi:hypothetical protein